MDDYTLFIKNGDTLSPHVAQYLNLYLSQEMPDMLYSDEAITFDNKIFFKFYKPDYSPELILSMNYFGNLLCVKTSLLKKINKIDSTHYENFLYEIVLKTLPFCKKITHVDEILYYRTISKNKISYDDYYANFDQAAGRKLLEKYCQDNQIDAKVLDGQYHGTYRIKYAIQHQPLISIIIPFKNKPDLLKACINSILKKSTYKNFEIIGIDNGSTEQDVFDLIKNFEAIDSRLRFHSVDVPFNYSLLNNIAVNQFAKGDHLLFLNNDTEVIEPTWIEAMLEHSQRADVGLVGAKLLYPDDSIQHCGVILGQRRAVHAHRQLPNNQSGYFYFPHVIRNYHVVTFACAMIKTALFKKIGGLDEHLKIAFNDVDICARVSALGYYNVYTPYAILYHYESKSRGMDDTQEKIILANWEQGIAMKNTPSLFLRDSFYNKHLTQYDDDFSEGFKEDIRGLLLILFFRIKRRFRNLDLEKYVR
ncbi:MAG: glycosyltransferase family 2 protein [Gammaproteobacteria bacterium]|nr:glycosyltransferase family 2 protein [Gammaproteobacteria bacterium]